MVKCVHSFANLEEEGIILFQKELKFPYILFSNQTIEENILMVQWIFKRFLKQSCWNN